MTRNKRHMVLAPSVNAERRHFFEVIVGHPIRVYSGSTKGQCKTCNADVWVGPRSTLVIDSGAADPICETCIFKAMQTGWRPDRIGNLENPEGGTSGVL